MTHQSPAPVNAFYRSITSFLFHPKTVGQRYAFGVGCAALALTLHWSLVPVAGARFPFLFFVPMLIFAATIAGRGPGLLVLVAAIISATFMLPPIGSIKVAAWQDQLMLVIFAVVSSVLVYFGSQYRLIGRKAAEAERRLALALTDNCIGLFETDWKTKKMFGSPVLWELAGLPVERGWVALEDWSRSVHSDDVSKSQALLEVNIRNGSTGFEHEFRVQLPSGEIRWLLSRVHIEREPSGEVASLRGATVNISHRKSLEAALGEADRRKDEFLATLAHELRNPLAPIRQAALIFKTPHVSDAQKRWSQDVIERQVKHMALLLDDLLDISRITRGVLELRKEPIELAAVIDAAVETARPAIDAKKHSLSVTVPAEPIHLSADALRLCQAITNLLTNAAKFTDPRGDIRLSAFSEDGQAIIRVRDNGVGIETDSQPGIFRMFARGHTPYARAEGGLGIGLALTKGIAELHGGSISVASAGIGYGSEFTLRLPLEKVDISQDNAARVAGVAEPTKIRRILIVDDNRDAADSLASLLQAYGHEVMTAYDGEEGLAAYLQFKPAIAVLDIGMPKLSGHEVAQHIRQLPSDRKITLIAATGWGQESDQRKTSAAGFDHHLIKPIDIERLTRILQSVDASAE